MNSAYVSIAVGVIKNALGQILIAQRRQAVAQGGLWEFPGGKVERGESIYSALHRELTEELGITVEQAQPLIQIRHRYPEMAVCLEVWEVTQFSGAAYGREDQPIRWVWLAELANYAFPAANWPIIRALQLPHEYAILEGDNCLILRQNLERILAKGFKLIQLRLKNLRPSSASRDFIEVAVQLCQAYQADVLINSAMAGISPIAHSGLHLSSYDLMQQQQRPKIKGWLAASCHNLQQLQQAANIEVDFAVLSPLLTTPSHPDAASLGWTKFAQLITQVNFPVYALGGLSLEHTKMARQHGAQGIAGIRAFLT